MFPSQSSPRVALRGYYYRRTMMDDVPYSLRALARHFRSWAAEAHQGSPPPLPSYRASYSIPSHFPATAARPTPRFAICGRHGQPPAVPHRKGFVINPFCHLRRVHRIGSRYKYGPLDILSSSSFPYHSRSCEYVSQARFQGACGEPYVPPFWLTNNR